MSGVRVLKNKYLVAKIPLFLLCIALFSTYSITSATADSGIIKNYAPPSTTLFFESGVAKGNSQYSSNFRKIKGLSNIFWPAPPAEPRIFFVRSISGTEDTDKEKSFFSRFKTLLVGDEEIAFARPMAIAIGADKKMYIADNGSASIYVYEEEKKDIKQIKQIDGAVPFSSPVGIGVSGDGVVFIADSHLRAVFAMEKNKKLKYALGEKDGIFRPAGLFVRDRKLYIVDSEKSYISIFDLEGKLLLRFGSRGKKDGEFNAPTQIYADNSGKIYVSDTLNFRIQIFDKSGKFLKSIGSIGNTAGHFSRPKGVSVDSYGNIYIVDGLLDNVQIFDYEKNLLLNFGKKGHGDGEFWLPVGITIDDDNYIYIADSYNKRVSIFRYVGGR